MTPVAAILADLAQVRRAHRRLRETVGRSQATLRCARAERRLRLMLLEATGRDEHGLLYDAAQIATLRASLITEVAHVV